MKDKTYRDLMEPDFQNCPNTGSNADDEEQQRKFATAKRSLADALQLAENIEQRIRSLLGRLATRP